MIRALFVCTQNRLRSPTAEQVFAQWHGVEGASAGVHRSADNPLSGELIEWADIIFTMEPVHRRQMAAQFGSNLNGKRMVLGIPDDYAFLDAERVALLETKAGPFLRP